MNNKIIINYVNNIKYQKANNFPLTDKYSLDDIIKDIINDRWMLKLYNLADMPLTFTYSKTHEIADNEKDQILGYMLTDSYNLKIDHSKSDEYIAELYISCNDRDKYELFEAFCHSLIQGLNIRGFCDLTIMFDVLDEKALKNNSRADASKLLFDKDLEAFMVVDSNFATASHVQIKEYYENKISELLMQMNYKDTGNHIPAID